MSISSLNTTKQTGLVPNSLLGYSSNGVSAIEITPTAITIAGDLNTATPIYVGISASGGLTTTLSTGLDVNCDFNMNGNDITNVATINRSGNIDIISQTDNVNLQSVTGMSLAVNNGALTLSSNGAGTQISTDQQIDLTAGGEMNFITPSGIWINTALPNIGDGDLYANFYGSLNGNATTATSATSVAITDNNTSATYYPTFVSNNTGNLALNVDKTTNPLSYIPSTGNLSSTLFTGLLSTGGLVYLSTGTQAITGSASATNINLTSIFNSTYKNYRIVLAPTTQLTFSAYPSYSLQAFSGTGTMPTTASLYGFEITSSATTTVSAVYTAGATISSSPLILAVSQVVNHQTIIEIENVGFTATTTQSLGLKCKSFYSNPGVSGASDRSILTSNISGSTVTGLVLQQSSISASNNMTIGWTIYAYK